MSNQYKGTYNPILIDKKQQSAVSGIKHSLTVEEYYDLMHHSHNMEDIVKSQDIENLDDALAKIDQLNTLVEEQGQIIDDQADEIESLKQQIANAVQAVIVNE